MSRRSAKAKQARTFLDGRDFVTPDDMQDVPTPSLAYGYRIHESELLHASRRGHISPIIVNRFSVECSVNGRDIRAFTSYRVHIEVAHGAQINGQ